MCCIFAMLLEKKNIWWSRGLKSGNPRVNKSTKYAPYIYVFWSTKWVSSRVYIATIHYKRGGGSNMGRGQQGNVRRRASSNWPSPVIPFQHGPN